MSDDVLKAIEEMNTRLKRLESTVEELRKQRAPEASTKVHKTIQRLHDDLGRPVTSSEIQRTLNLRLSTVEGYLKSLYLCGIIERVESWKSVSGGRRVRQFGYLPKE